MSEGEGEDPHLSESDVFALPPGSSRAAASATAGKSLNDTALYESLAPRLLVDATGRLQGISATATEVLRRSDCLKLKGGHLRAPREQAKLEECLAHALESDGAVEIILESEEPDCTGLFLRARRSRAASTCLLIVLKEIGRASVDLPDLRKLFGLTKAEHQVIVLLINGSSVAEIADQLCNSELTVRTHLKRSYFKLGVRTKEQLFGKLLQMMAD